MTLTPPFGYFGSKVRIAPAIVEAFPRHAGYVEPFAGSLSVLLAKAPSTFEVVNDLDGDLVHFWRVLRERPDELAYLCALTPHSRQEYAAAWPIPDDVDDLERARRVWVKLSQGRGGALRTTGWRYHEAPGGRASSMPRTLSGYVRRMLPIAARLAEVTLECLPALEVIARYGRDAGTLLYADPPYLATTRGAATVYRHELSSSDEHRALAEALHAAKAAVVLSGYPSDLYDLDLYADWHRLELKAATGQNAAAGYQERTEVLWSNRPFPTTTQESLLLLDPGVAS